MKLFYLLAAGAAVMAAGCGGESNESTGNPASQPAGGEGAGNEVVVIGTNPDYPPFEFTDPETGEIVGFEVDMMEALAAEAGLEVEWKPVKWQGIFAALERGDIDAVLSAATITEERQQKYDFSDSYFTISQKLVILDKDKGQIQEVSDLNDKRIGVKLATTGALLVETEYPQWETATFDNTSTAFADLAAGKIFGFMVDGPVAEAYGRSNPQTADLFYALPFEFSKEDYGIVFRQDDDELRERINAALKTIKDEGILEQLEAKWFQ